MALITSIIHSDPEILGGTPVFTGTRVPVKIMVFSNRRPPHPYRHTVEGWLLRAE